MHGQYCIVRVRKNHMLNYEYERVTKSKVCQILISWVDKVKARRAQTDPQTQKKRWITTLIATFIIPITLQMEPKMKNLDNLSKTWV